MCLKYILDQHDIKRPHKCNAVLDNPYSRKYRVSLNGVRDCIDEEYIPKNGDEIILLSPLHGNGPWPPWGFGPRWRRVSLLTRHKGLTIKAPHGLMKF